MSIIEKHLKAVENKLNSDPYYKQNPTSKNSILAVEKKHLLAKIEQHERLKRKYQNRP